MANEVVFTRTEKIWLAEDGIIRCIVLPTPKHKLEDAGIRSRGTGNSDEDGLYGSNVTT
jgi:hypothetical protein